MRMQLFTIHLEYSSVSIMKYSLEQMNVIYDKFVKYESWRTVAINYLQSFPDSPEPSKAMIFNLVKKFCIILYWIRNKHEEMLGCMQTDRASHSVSHVALKAMHCTMLISCPHQILYAMQSAVLGV